MPTYLTSEHLEEPIQVTERLVIGRKRKLCDVAFVSDKSISSRHCFVMQRDDEVVVRDLESKNGVFVNDIQISGVHPLEVGDRLRVGNFIEFQVVDLLKLPEPDYLAVAREAASAAPMLDDLEPSVEPAASRGSADRSAGTTRNSAPPSGMPKSSPPSHPSRSPSPETDKPSRVAGFPTLKPAKPPVEETPTPSRAKAKPRRKPADPPKERPRAKRVLNNDFDALDDAVQLERGSVGRKVHKAYCDQCDHRFSVMVASHIDETFCPKCEHEIPLGRRTQANPDDEPVRYTSEWKPTINSLEIFGNIGLVGMGLVMAHFVVLSLFGAAYYGRPALSVFIPFEEGGVDLPEGMLLAYGTLAVIFLAAPIVVLFVASRVAEEFNGLLRLAAGIGVPIAMGAWQGGSGVGLIRVGFLIYGVPLAISIVPMFQLWTLPTRLRHLFRPLMSGTIGLMCAAVFMFVASALPYQVSQETTQRLGVPEMIGVPGLALAAMIAVIIWGAGQTGFSMYFSGSASAIKEPNVRRAMDTYFYVAVGSLLICVLMLAAMAVPLITGPTGDLCWLVAAGAATAGTVWFYQLPTFLRDSIH